MKIIEYSENFNKEITDLFYSSVHAIDSSIYTDEQKKAWAPGSPDYNFWEERLKIKKPFLAIIHNKLAGFIELEHDGHIDCAYTHPEFQRQGVASSLLNHTIHQAKRMTLAKLHVEASKVARPFFEKHGFTLVSENQIIRNDIILVNYAMELNL